MRVLWFSTNSSGYKFQNKKETVTYGGWMVSLQQELAKRSSIELGVCFCADGLFWREEQEGVTYYPVPNHRKAWKDKVLDLIHYKDVCRDEMVWPHYISHFKRVIDDFRPDFIEVFGSELYIGLGALAARDLKIPCALHHQGLLSLYIYIFLPPGISQCQYIWKDWNPFHAFARFQELVYWRRSCHREKTILRSVPHVMGRTEWDRQATCLLALQAQYHYGGEILRPEFYGVAERCIPSKPTLSTTISAPTYKGFDLLLKVANILKNELHIDFEWNVYGNVETTFWERCTGIRHQDVNVKVCGVVNARDLREALLGSTLYFHPSYIENSPNSVCEAQILGLPVVATNVGGTSSLVEHGRTGFLFPATDPYVAAYYIQSLVMDILLNKKMGKDAYLVAVARHNRLQIVDDLITTYHKIMVSSAH